MTAINLVVGAVGIGGIVSWANYDCEEYYKKLYLDSKEYQENLCCRMQYYSPLLKNKNNENKE